ncbi:MAG: peptidylprolyl isomerase [Coriobacteriia bacterium]
MFRGIAALILLIAMSLAVAGCERVDAVARVNGDDITRAEFDRIYQQVVTQMGGQIPEDQAAQYKQQLLDMMVESVLITQQADELGADLSDEAIEERIIELRGETDEATFEEQVTAAGLTMQDLRDSVRDQIAREFLMAEASAGASSGTLPEDYALLEHILVAEEAAASDLKSQIAAGGDFAELAAANSTDPGSAAQGGSLGWSAVSAYVQEFAAVAVELAVGEISDPVQSNFGWHVIRKMDEMRAGEPIADAPEELKTLLSANSGELALQEYVANLREEADIEYLDETLAPVQE